MSRLNGKVAVITRATSELGSSQVLLFAREGATVIVADTDAVGGKDLADSVNAQGGKALFQRLDVVKENQWEALARAVASEFGGIDVLVNNAQLSTVSRAEEISRDEWDDVLTANSKGAFLGVKTAIASMLPRGGGSIIHVSSVAGMIPPKGSSEAYAASSGALRILAKDVSADYAADNIRCNSVHAGLVGAMFANCDEQLSPEKIAELLKVTPMRRVGTADEVSFGVLFLASDEASYITGTELVIDGGMVGF